MPQIFPSLLLCSKSYFNDNITKWNFDKIYECVCVSFKYLRISNEPIAKYWFHFKFVFQLWLLIYISLSSLGRTIRKSFTTQLSLTLLTRINWFQILFVTKSRRHPLNTTTKNKKKIELKKNQDQNDKIRGNIAWTWD